MIIKEIRIGSFAGIENKVISFENGMNIIYGNNEAGKSRIESFIKVMLYGFSNKRIKGINERKKYISFNKDTAYGEMLVSHNQRDYLIKRKFGNTKKYDLSEVLDYLTGEKVEYINSNEPGKYFLGINRATFEKTLCISQLSVAFSKDKEEEIMDKITALFGCGDNEVSGEKAIMKLDGLRKNYTTSRGAGTLDLLNKKYQNLQEERHEGMLIAEKNLNWEKELIDKKQDKQNINEEIDRLEVYKKYLKKIKLQNEYKEIIKYFKESEALKREENKIVRNISKDGNVVDEEFLDDILKENNQYLSLIDDKKEKEEEFKFLCTALNDKNIEFEKYKFIDFFEDNLKDRLLEIKFEQKSFEEKINSFNEIKLSINEDESNLKAKKAIFEKLSENKELGEEIISNLNLYESKLKELKETAYSEKMYLELEKEKNNKKFRIILGCLIGIFGSVLFFIKGINIIISLILIVAGASLIYIGITRFKEFKKLSNKNMAKLTKDIEKIESFLSDARNKLSLENNEELIKFINKYMMFKQYEEKVLIRIEEKRKILKNNNYEEILKRYAKNNEMVDSLIKLSSCENINQVIDAIDNYTKIKSEIDVIDEKKLYLKNIIESKKSAIEEKEYLLKDRLKIIGAQEIPLLDLDVFIKEYKEKVKRLQEINNNLKSIEKTYNVLIKGRDIDKIREDLKDIISDDSSFSYESEDEIETEEKLKSKELIECEKDIKDIENRINSRMIGKRSLVEIEEEMELVVKELNKSQKSVSAIDLAMETLKESMDEIRRSVGPALNRSIADIFSYVTDGKYQEIKLDSNYEMLVRNKDDLFKGNYLSNGAYDQLYLSLRIALIEILFKEDKYCLILDDAFVQYDNKRRETALLLLKEKIRGQMLIFTCHDIERNIMLKNSMDFNYIQI